MHHRHTASPDCAESVNEEVSSPERTLAFLLECEFSLLVVVLVLSPSPVFTTLGVRQSCSYSLSPPWRRSLVRIAGERRKWFDLPFPCL